MQEVHERYRDLGLKVIGFPSNDFQNQEPFGNAKIKADMAARYGVNFQLMDKINVNGPNTHQVFQYLKGNSKELISKRDANKIL